MQIRPGYFPFLLLLGAVLLIGCSGGGGDGAYLNVVNGTLTDKDRRYPSGPYFDEYGCRADQDGTATVVMASPDFRCDGEVAAIVEGELVIPPFDREYGPGNQVTLRFSIVKDRIYLIIAKSMEAQQTGRYTLTFSPELDDIRPVGDPINLARQNTLLRR